MKVLLVNKFHWNKGGSEKYYFELGQLLKEHGNEVAYFSMKDDRKFMAICKDFISDFHASVKNRNKASHGGSIISLETCKEDKNNVLNNVDKVRKEGKGLIKQFIRILAFNE